MAHERPWRRTWDPGTWPMPWALGLGAACMLVAAVWVGIGLEPTLGPGRRDGLRAHPERERPASPSLSSAAAAAVSAASAGSAGSAGAARAGASAVPAGTVAASRDASSSVWGLRLIRLAARHGVELVSFDAGLTGVPQAGRPSAVTASFTHEPATWTVRACGPYDGLRAWSAAVLRLEPGWGLQRWTLAAARSVGAGAACGGLELAVVLKADSSRVPAYGGAGASSPGTPADEPSHAHLPPEGSSLGPFASSLRSSTDDRHVPATVAGGLEGDPELSWTCAGILESPQGPQALLSRGEQTLVVGRGQRLGMEPWRVVRIAWDGVELAALSPSGGTRPGVARRLGLPAIGETP